MKEIMVDVRRAVCSGSFLLAALAMAGCLVMGAFRSLWQLFQMEWPQVLLGYHEELFLACLEGELALFVVPILSAAPYTAAYVEDVKSGYLKPYLIRTTVGRYVWGKSLGAALSGGLALAAGLGLAFGLLWLVCAPLEVPGEEALPSLLPEIGLRLLLFFLSGALWATVGLLFSALAQNVCLAYASPFLLCYLLIILQERYFRAARPLNPRTCLTLQGMGGGSAALILLSLVVLFQLLFCLTAGRQLRDRGRRRALSSFAARLPRIPKRDFKLRREPGPLRELRQVLTVVRYDFCMWRGNVRILLTFALAFILCFLLSDKAAAFACEMGTAMQAFEPFVWTFGDANSILLVSLLLILLFVDMPFLGPAVPYYLVRMRRRTWAWGQLLYLTLATLLYMLFIFAATALLCAQNSFLGNMWSETAAILGYSGAGKAVALPALVKTLEMSRPYACAGAIFLLMLLYTLVLSLIMLLLKLWKGRSAGIVGAFGFSLYGLLLNPAFFKDVLHLPDELIYKANVIVGWASPLNQAAYHMHSFGYDLLPRLRDTYLIFGALILLLFALVQLSIRRYSFTFTGTEGSL